LEINAIMRTHLSQALVGEVEPQEALDAMAEEIEALIGE
jgi:ABC-type glycerol-3-phosphate transport system substrate-binding protein